MAHKLWEKNFEVNKEIERFTVGRDRELDLYLAKYDVLGSMAHITMLESIGLLGKEVGAEHGLARVAIGWEPDRIGIVCGCAYYLLLHGNKGLRGIAGMLPVCFIYWLMMNNSS